MPYGTRLEITRAREALRHMAPNFRFGIDLHNPINRGAENYRTITITYNADLAEERGFNQTRMREVVRYALSDLATTVECVTFKPTRSAPINVNADKVAALSDAIKKAARKSDDKDDFAETILTAVAKQVSRKDAEFLKAVVDSL